jgi:DNA-binding transcriptional regulator YiaG
MRYKNNVLDKLVQLEASTNKVQFQVNRGVDQDTTLESIEQIKEQIEKIREIVSLEQDDFAQQLAR